MAFKMPPMAHIEDLRFKLEEYLDSDETVRIALLLDEIDRYISANPDRHLLIETLRSLSQRYKERFRVIVTGYMELYDCLHLRGPYTETSDPWARTFEKKLLNNLTAENYLKYQSKQWQWNGEFQCKCHRFNTQYDLLYTFLCHK